MMGASNPHPHCQIWSTATIPNIPRMEQESQLAYRDANGLCLLCDYFRLEKNAGARTVVENEHFLALVPYWAVWPFETMILSRRHLASIDELNRLYDSAHATGWVPAGTIDTTLSDALTRTDREIGGTGVVVPARPKSTLLNWYFQRAAVDGMTDPYFLETLVSSELLPFERPFVLAHEWSHLTGLADEGDANFLGWLACVRAAPPQQYSGWLFLYTEVSATFRGRDRSDLVERLGPGPRADLTAIRDRFAREVSPKVSAAGWRVYDQYLKANRVQAGAASYAEVVRLVLGTRSWSSVVSR